MSAVSYVLALWKGVGGTFSMYGYDGDRDADDLTLLVYGQALWMAVTLVVLFALALLSARLYFVVSFIGLLCNRVLFAPRAAVGRWWRVVNAITWLCFAVLSYNIYLRVRASVSVPA